MQPIIVIPIPCILDEVKKTFFYKLGSDYVEGIMAAGGFPLLLPRAFPAELLEELADRAGGLLLSGGMDVSPLRYGGENPGLCGEISLERDALEFSWLDAFVRRSKPVFGICRGLQVINTYFGGTLWQDLTIQKGVVHRGVHHGLKCRDGYILNKLFGLEFQVNSFHHQAVLELGKDMVSTAYSNDIIEAVEHKYLPIWGVQFHPERMLKGNEFAFDGPDMHPLFDYFVEQSRRR